MRYTNFIAFLLILFTFIMAVSSMKDDSLTMDEVAHLPAGYSYLTQQDMRLNPEHPPLIKDIAAVPLLFIKGIKFPSEIKDWKEDINGQWGFGYHFLYKTGNPADQMIFWSRIFMILMLLILGLYIFKWTKELFGDKAGLLALFLFSFSPAFIAHGRLVTTDIAAALGVLIGLYYFIKALKQPTAKNIIFAGIAFGIAQLLKFSLFLLLPFFCLLALVFWLIKAGKFWPTLKVLILVFVIGYLLVGLFYQFHVANYPLEKQAKDIEFLLSSTPYPIVTTTLLKMANIPALKGYAQYILGLSLVFQRASGGHTTYFLGEISAGGWPNYFPFVYLIKEPLPFHIITLFALIFILWSLRKRPNILDSLRKYFPEFAIAGFILLYWLLSLRSPLNIGVRHLLPALSLTFILISGLTIKNIKETCPKIKYPILAILLLWQAFSFISIYPFFLTYFNELVGQENGYLYTVDSNLDWGQDLKRLKQWTEEKDIGRIYIDYFGGSDASYYFQEKYLPWQGDRSPEEMEKPGWLAVSATFLQAGKGKPAQGFDQPTGYYNWLNEYQPVVKIGNSIFVYYIE